MKKYNLVIYEAGWGDGSGWSYDTVYDRSTEELEDNEPLTFDWMEGWANEQNFSAPPEGEDVQFTATYYDAADEDEDNPLASKSIWMSDYSK